MGSIYLLGITVATMSHAKRRSYFSHLDLRLPSQTPNSPFIQNDNKIAPHLLIFELIYCQTSGKCVSYIRILNSEWEKTEDEENGTQFQQKDDRFFALLVSVCETMPWEERYLSFLLVWCWSILRECDRRT